MRSITKGITGTEMIAYEYVYSEEDRQAVTDFILDKQEGNRQTLRFLYSRDYFKGKRLTPELFDSVESDSQESSRKIFSTPNEHLMAFFGGSPKYL